MPPKPTTAQLQRAQRAFKECDGNVSDAARRIKVPRSTLRRWLDLKPEVDNGDEFKPAALLAELVAIMREHSPDLSFAAYKRLSKHPGAYAKQWTSWDEFKLAARQKLPLAIKADPERVFEVLSGHALTKDDLARRLAIKPDEVNKVIERTAAEGYNVQLRGNVYQIERMPARQAYDPKLHLFESDESGWCRFLAVSDNHIGSKYARLDVLNDLYDFAKAEGITRVYNCGNWIDGEARFNRHDLEPWAHGMDNQLEAFARYYPQRAGINTFYVAGDDHEGWYDGIDIGLRAQHTARDMGRSDLHYIGYMESFIRLRHAGTRNGSVMAVVHPGGGSAYALSYSPQKIVESYQGGEKPSVAVFGHYHKMDVFNYRNVWIIQDGCTQDQTPFMRKKRIEAHVGGVLVEVKLDKRGAVVDCRTWQKRYFDRAYYNYQFDKAHPIKRVMVPS